MKVVRTIAQMRDVSAEDIGFVPTMGALHEGHLTLMREARERHRTACVSIFVNPLQFGPQEDLDKYPRNETRDLDLAQGEGIDVAFVPSAREIYPHESTIVRVPHITERWEGAARPGHFDGVATVVAKLFNIIRPRAAFFGWKDLQQCLVIRRMVEDLNIPVELSFQPTVREADGLAMSSRNQYLSPEDRIAAPELYRALVDLSQKLPITANLLERAREHLTQAGFVVDYLDLVDLDQMNVNPLHGEAALIAAARLGSTRLIDNVRINLP